MTVGKVVFIIFATTMIFEHDLLSLIAADTDTSILLIGIITPGSAFILSILTFRKRLFLAANLGSGSSTGVLVVATSLILYALGYSSAEFVWLRSFALIGFLTGLATLLFGSSLVKMLTGPLVATGFLVPLNLGVETSIDLALIFTASSTAAYMLLYFRSQREGLVVSCAHYTRTTYMGVEFCSSCGRAIASPKHGVNRKDVTAVISVSILLLIAVNISIPFFHLSEKKQSIRIYHLNGYTDEGLFDPSASLNLRYVPVNASQYFVEGVGVNATLKIFENSTLFASQLANIRADQPIRYVEQLNSPPQATYFTVNGQKGNESILYWSGRFRSFSPAGFAPFELSFIIESSSDPMVTKAFLANIAENIVGRLSNAGSLTYNAWRSWELYQRSQDYLPIVPSGALLLASVYIAKRKDNQIETLVEQASNMTPNDQMLLACLAATASKTGSASGLDVAEKWSVLSSLDQNEYVLKRLEHLASLGLVKKILSGTAEPTLRWKPVLPAP